MVTATPTMERQRGAHSRILRLEGIDLIASAGSSAELLVQELELVLLSCLLPEFDPVENVYFIWLARETRRVCPS
jgi:hypothetical protein